MKIRSLALALTAACGLATPALAQLESGNPAAQTYMSLLLDPSTLVLRTDSQHQQIEIQVGPVPGEVAVFGIDGIPSGTVFTGIDTIDLMTGAGIDYVEFRVWTNRPADIFVATGLGDSDVKVIYDMPTEASPAVSNVTVTGNRNNDKVSFEGTNLADDFTGNWNVVHGGGFNEAKVSFQSLEPTSSLRANLFATNAGGQDILDFNIISNAALVAGSVGGRLNAGVDSAFVKIDSLRPANASLALDLNMGSGNDAAEIAIINLFGTSSITGTITGAANDDNLKLLQEGNGSVNATLSGGDGADYADMEFKGLVTGAPKLLGGNGNDFLKIVTDSAQVATPTLNGGAGFDEAIGWGTFIGVEKIN